MHKTIKSDLMASVESVVPKSESVPDVDVKIVHILDPKKSQVSVKRFHDYAQLVFLPYYIDRMCLQKHNIPVDWKSFIRCDANKDSLFHLLADEIREFHPHQRKQVISTYGQNAISSVIADLSDLSCTHEEADTRLLFHASHSFHHVYTKLMIPVRPVLHTRRSGHTAPVPCLPFVPSCIYQADDTCQTCPTHTKKRTHGSCSTPPIRSIIYIPSC